jgi:hypothetical protein
MRRRLLPIVAAVGLVVSVAFLLHCFDEPICEENYVRIEPGMTQAEVETILGRPINANRLRSERHETHRWDGDAYQITVVYDQKGMVAFKSSEWMVSGKPTPSLSKRLRRMVGL